MSAPDRPTRNHVDAALARWAAFEGGETDADLFAAEVRALRAELGQARDVAQMWRSTAMVPGPPVSTLREVWPGLTRGLDQLAAAVLDESPRFDAPLPAVPDGEDETIRRRWMVGPGTPVGSDTERNALLRHYLGKVAFRVGLPDQARRVTPMADLDQIESVGEAVLAELERLRSGSSQPDSTDVVARLHAAAAALSDTEPMSCAGGDLFGIAVALGYMPTEVRAAVAAALALPTEPQK